MKPGQDIFLIYARTDSDAAESNGWVFNLHRLLEMLLGRISGLEIKITTIPDNELSFEEIYSPSSIILPIISDELLKSHNFNEEVKVFHEKAIHKSRNNIAWESRIFKIFKYPYEGHFLLDFLSNSIGYNFFHLDPTTDQIVTYTDFTGPDSEKTFWMRLYDLAYDLWRVIEQLSEPEAELKEINRSLNAFKIYLAETGHDLSQERDMIRRELTRSGFDVLPDRRLPEDIDAIHKVVKKDLKNCRLSIHLVGADIISRRHQGLSLTEVQNNLAIEHFNNLVKVSGATDTDESGRILWISPTLDRLTLSQKVYLENLRKGSDYLHTTDILECSIEELKAFVLKKISQMQQASESFDFETADEGGKLIYLIYDKLHDQRAIEISKMLKNSGHQVLVSDFEGTAEEVQRKHNEKLKKCDATLIYYGNDNDKWVKSKLKDLAKALGLGRDRPIFPQAIVVDSETSDFSITRDSQNALVLNSKSDDSFLEPFLSRLKSEL
ncbi:MAG: hypothetical protein ACFCUU_01430 [Cyclobacteriaceae bacterium]